MAKAITANTRRELVDALRSRYGVGSREQKGRILAEFVATSAGFPGTVHPFVHSRFCRGAAGVIRRS